eukprot:5127098-Pleurochrysis_carterae.AAC.2
MLLYYSFHSPRSLIYPGPARALSHFLHALIQSQTKASAIVSRTHPTQVQPVPAAVSSTVTVPAAVAHS